MDNLPLVRGRYETESTINSENQIAKYIEAVWKCFLRKLTLPYRIDFALEKDGAVRAWLEIKCRNYPSTRYPTLMISVLKWETGILHAQATRLPFIIAVKFSDGFKFYQYSAQHEVSFKWGGRIRDQRDTSDIEPVVHIPMELFKTLR